jgi:hypothetical protein
MRQDKLDALHDQIMAMDFDDVVRMNERFQQETETEVREQPMKCVIALSSLLVQAKMLSDAMDHEDVLRTRRLARAILKAGA